MEEKKVRVRFAPSPTGPLHIGGVRTALYNYLFARHHGGTMILRIEDTDQNRYVPGAEDYIVESLQWCGIQFDEGVHVGGPHAPYRQSDRKDIYRRFADELISMGDAYYAFDTPAELDTLRREHESRKETFNYDFSTRPTLRNSLSMEPDEVKSRITSGEPYVIRYKMPENEVLSFSDLIRGDIGVSTQILDDKVLFKSDGMPTYHLANVVDDHLMEITHVIRGEEWLPSLPLHVLLYRSFGWNTPLFAHLPLILKPEGSGKLSKRDGDRLGFPVFPIEWKDPVTGEVSSGYRESGYYPETVINMLALLGWNPGTEQEIFSMDDLISQFTLERVGKSGSRFDPAKARWFNHYYLGQQKTEDLAADFIRILDSKGIKASFQYVEKVVSLVKERADFVSDFWSHSFFFFEAPAKYDEAIIRKRWKTPIPELINGLREDFGRLDPFNATTIKEMTEGFAAAREANTGALLNSLRLCVAGGSYGPDLFTMLEVIGKEEVLRRLEKALYEIGPPVNSN